MPIELPVSREFTREEFAQGDAMREWLDDVKANTPSIDEERPPSVTASSDDGDVVTVTVHAPVVETDEEWGPDAPG